MVDRPHTLFSKKPPRAHGKLYAIGGIKYSNEIWKDYSNPVAGPVDEDKVLERLRSELTARGFHEAAPNTVPDIVITVFYGRAHMKNPYISKTMEIDGADYGFYGGKVVAVNSSENEIGREKMTPGYYEKLQRANSEKLFIAINAWEFGFDSMVKRKLLWRTTVSVDEADRDLNEIADKMIAAAGRYFDHEMTEEEVTVMSNVPEGKVGIGSLSEVGKVHPDK